ncbi:hypothetical protein E2320_006200 [Naja naja]|nr:hypothetical protein E2320_006200 [Naja naja]
MVGSWPFSPLLSVTHRAQTSFLCTPCYKGRFFCSHHGLFRLPCWRIKFSGMSLQCINLASGPAGTMQPLPQPSTSGNSCTVTPPPKSVHPSVSIGKIQVFHHVLFSSCQLLQLCPRQRFPTVVAPLGHSPLASWRRKEEKRGCQSNLSGERGTIRQLGAN